MPMPARRRLLPVLIASAILALAGACASSATSSRPASVSPAAANRAAARLDVTKLLSRLLLPAGAQRSATEPNGGGHALAHPISAPATPNLVDRHQWWIVPGTPKAVLAYISRHAPAGSRVVLTGSGSGPGGVTLTMVGYGWPAVPGVLGSRELVIGAVRHGEHTLLRVDAQDVWISPRPASERIPAGTTRLRLVVSRGTKVQQGPLAFVSSAKLQRVTALLNELPAAQPGVVACPSDPGVRVTLRFFAGQPGPPLAVAVVNPGGCGGVQLTLAGKPQPALAGGPIPGEPRASLVEALGSDLGVKLNVSPLGG
jgi:hypothetical protein